jgi:hypothetical protein
LKTVTTIVKVLSLVSGLSSYAGVIPAKVLPFALLTFAAASSLKDVVVVVGDFLDDRQLNKSYTGV